MAASGITAGVVFVISMHTTTAIMINESLPCVEKDIELTLERLIPTDGDYVHTHMLQAMEPAAEMPGTFEVNALRKSLCASGNRWKNSEAEVTGIFILWSSMD
ncbi:MAG: YjbQ family protein [Clostridium fessum]